MKLTSDQIAAQLAELPDWSQDGVAIVKEYQFDDFVQAFGFMTSAALVAEKLNHHPDWTNIYNKVTVRLTTHEADGSTRLDFALARHLDKLGR